MTPHGAGRQTSPTARRGPYPVPRPICRHTFSHPDYTVGPGFPLPRERTGVNPALGQVAVPAAPGGRRRSGAGLAALVPAAISPPGFTAGRELVPGWHPGTSPCPEGSCLFVHKDYSTPHPLQQGKSRLSAA